VEQGLNQQLAGHTVLTQIKQAGLMPVWLAERKTLAVSLSDGTHHRY
jgi:hypothetical protein